MVTICVGGQYMTIRRRVHVLLTIATGKLASEVQIQKVSGQASECAAGGGTCEARVGRGGTDLYVIPGQVLGERT
jgi:hypothetical protein